VIERLREAFESSSLRWAIIGLYVLSLALTIGVYIGISVLDVPTAAYFRGSPELEKGRPNAVRGVILNARTGKFRRDVEVDFYLQSERQQPAGEASQASEQVTGERIGRARPGLGGIVHATLDVPEETERGPHDLVVQADGPGMDPFRARTSVQVEASGGGSNLWLPLESRFTDPERQEEWSAGPVIEQNGELAVDVLPPDGEVPRGLSAQMHLVTYDAETGEPVSAEVRFEAIEGLGQWGQGVDLPERVETDEMGLASISFEAAGGQKWSLAASEIDASGENEPREGTTKLQLHTVASQISLSLESPYVGRDRRVRGRIDTLFQGGELLVDVYRGPDWLTATGLGLKARKGEFEFDAQTVRAKGGWLYRLQMSRDFYSAGNAWDVAHLVALESGDKEEMREAVGRTASLVAENRDEAPYFEWVASEEYAASIPAGREELEEWLSAYLRAIPRHFARGETLVNSQQADRKQLEAWKDDVQSDLMVVIIAALVGGFAVLLYVIVAGIRRNRRHDRRLREVDDELAADEEGSEADALEPDVTSTGPLSGRIQAGLLGVVAVATLVMFALGLILLLSYL
jgi:hypothetical protein